MSNMTKTDQYLEDLEIAKRDIKESLEKKGATITGGLSSYSEAIMSIPAIADLKTETLNETITKNGQYTYTPSEGSLYDGVNVDVNLKTEPLSDTITENGAYSYTPEEDSLFRSVDIEVDVFVPTIQPSKSVTYSEFGDYSVTPDEGYDALAKVDVSVSLESKPKIYNGFAFTGGDMAKVDFSQYDWSMVYDTSLFFKSCTHSTGDWSNFEQNFNGRVLTGYYMFTTCKYLTSIPQLDTSNVTNMSNMFTSCNSLTSIPQLDTSNVVDMNNMFYGCNSLTSIPQLDTSNVVDMSYMFYGCRSLTSIPQLDTSNVTNMSNMFRDCTSLTSIPQLDTSNVTNMYYMFTGCIDLTSIPQLDTSNVTNMSYMFYNCTLLTSIPQLDTSNVSNMYNMFYRCYSLTSIPQLDISNATDMSNMFSNCAYLTEVRFKGNPSKLKSKSFMFGQVDTTGTLYYDDRYDYSEIVTLKPSKWTAVPYNVEEYEASLQNNE